ncbi:hypothetical protein C2845_PM12G17880 [Panicum miliaceum]|uniref:Uncharacterized protein n=1 Tax=Panicum miliaceum TaxID=4540 RepID=A0A3L6QKC6_PANMI|nr:hypothetical protein C2845_PM12G17880 [Panicum miliaceum]
MDVGRAVELGSRPLAAAFVVLAAGSCGCRNHPPPPLTCQAWLRIWSSVLQIDASALQIRPRSLSPPRGLAPLQSSFDIFGSTVAHPQAAALSHPTSCPARPWVQPC